jgi:hypothetical protein
MIIMFGLNKYFNLIKIKKVQNISCIFSLSLFLFIFASICNGYCQQSDKVLFKRNTIFADFATKAALYSINYDRIFRQYKTVNLSGQIGICVLKEDIAFPIGINLFTGKGNSHVEYSLIFVPYIESYKSFLHKNDLSDKRIFIEPGVGYRFQKPNGGFFFKAVVSPTLYLDPPSDYFWRMDPKLYLIANVGLGLSF